MFRAQKRCITSNFAGFRRRRARSSILGAVNEEWAKGMDQRGLPGTAVLKAFLAALAHE